MYFGFDDDQLAVRDAVAALLDKRAGLPVLQHAWSDPGAPEVWTVWGELAEMGVHGLLAPETAGGSAMDWVTMALVLAEAGRVALPLPLLETAAIGVPVLAAAGDPLGVVPSLVDGSAVLVAAPGPPGGNGDGSTVPVAAAGPRSAPAPGSAAGSLVPAASRADWFLLGGVLYARSEVTVEPVLSVDRTRDAGIVSPAGRGTRIGGAPGEPAAADLGALATAAVLVGLGRSMVQMTVEYVKERRQFGVPVGSFQAVKHHLADATMHVEFAAPTVWAAAWELSHPEAAAPGRAGRSVSLAKAMASDAAARAARTALQCHGAMGYADEYHLHMWMKRAWCLAASYGTALEHRRRLGAGFGLYR